MMLHAPGRGARAWMKSPPARLLDPHYQARLPAMERALRALGKTPELTVS